MFRVLRRVQTLQGLLVIETLRDDALQGGVRRDLDKQPVLVHRCQFTRDLTREFMVNK
jgi:hypothetical protein